MNNDNNNRNLNNQEFREAWNTLSAEIDANPENDYLKRQGFWLCYFKLKSVQEEIRQRAEQDRHPSHAEQEQSNWLISRMKILGPAPPDPKHYGPMMGQLRDTGQFYKDFIKMVLHYGSGFFSQEDHVPYKGEKYESPSQVVKTTRMTAKAWLTSGREWQLDLSAVLDLLRYAEENAKDSTKIWLEYDHAKCLVSAGKFDEARTHILKVLRNKNTEGWAWAALAATYRKENPEAAIVCFCKALSFGQDPVFTIPQRKALIPLLVQQGDVQTASMLLHSLADIYTSHDWPLKADVQELLAMDWYDASVTAEGLVSFFKKIAGPAESYLYGETIKRAAIVDSVHKSGKGFSAFVSSEEKFAVRKAVMSGKKLPCPGQWVQLSIVESDENGKEVIAAMLGEAQQSDEVSQKTGTLGIHEKGFAFVGDTFIAPHLVNKDWDGKEVMVTQVWDVNPRKRDKSWRGIRIDLVSQGESQ